MGIPSQSDRMSYLGIPISGRRPRCSDFSYLERRIRDRLDGWQVSGLSMMARITLIRSVLSSMPAYLLSNTAIPLACLRKIERYFREFLWASNQDGHGIHLMAWDSVCLPLAEGGLGIQSLLLRREALTARHASRFVLDPNCLWSSFMRAKYGSWNSSSIPQSSRGHSFYWKEVCRHSSTILDCTSWIIGNGSSVDAIQDAWIADLPLSRWPTFICSDTPHGMRVSDLISDDCPSWSHSRVASFCGTELCRRILSIPLSPFASTDTRVWRRSCLSRAPMRDLLSMFRTYPQDSRDWDWIWHLSVHPRVRLFIWKLAHGIFPTCFLLSYRGLSIQPTCPVCGIEDETIDHAIFDCARARQIWQLSGTYPWVHSPDSHRISFLRLLKQGLGGPTHHRGSLWAYTAYQIWLSRNQIVFADTVHSPRKVLRTASSLFAEYSSHQDSFDFANLGHWVSPAAAAANRRTVFISWEPPPPGFVKINFDGSVRGRSAGSAYVIRDADGRMLAAGGFSLLDPSVPMTELYAAWAGLSFAIRTLGARKLIIEGDSIIVIRWIRQQYSSRLPSIPILCDIRAMILEASNIQIRHVYREANVVADWIAARMASHSGHWIWRPGDYCPLIMSQLLVSDVTGPSRPRVV